MLMRDVVLQKKLDRGKYFPITAVQRFDAAVSVQSDILFFYLDFVNGN